MNINEFDQRENCNHRKKARSFVPTEDLMDGLINDSTDELTDDSTDEFEAEDGITRSLSEPQQIELEPGLRLDTGIAAALAKSRSFIQTLFETGNITVNGETKKANYKVKAGDRVAVVVPAPRELKIEPEELPLDIVYEDEDLLVVNKAQGMVVHPAPGAWQGTLVNALLFRVRSLSGINGVLRPGIVHRIDKDTSGLLLVAKNDLAHQGLAEQIKDHRVKRNYLAFVHGVVKEAAGTVDAPIGRDPQDRKRMAVRLQNSKSAITHYRVMERFTDLSYIEASLETGRTHQIRVHMAYIKHPVLGDPLYGPRHNCFSLQGQMLHAYQLAFTHPRTGEEMVFKTGLPQRFEEIFARLRRGEA